MKLRPIPLPASGVYLYESKHQEGDTIDPHHHAVHQMLFALEGRGTIKVDRTAYDFTTDNAVILTPQTDHAIVSDAKLTLLVLAFDAGRLDADVRRELLQESFPQSAYMPLNGFTASELRPLLRKMLFEQSRPSALGGWAMRIYLLEMLLLLARSKHPAPIHDSNQLRAERIRAYIDGNYYEPIQAGDLGSKLGLSARHINQIFKDQYQLTPTQYLTEVRVQVAQKLLQETDKDIVSICFEVGYENLSTFYRTFKGVVNMSPNQYRKVYRGTDIETMRTEAGKDEEDHDERQSN
ncbi:helix-turn-helix domain-containing protein [Paenibacillus sp. HJGM_3]|uniref:helix-turn-helix domain-containing protein n=1 Tax=Paenibacillus sp. HJGM_3 TaxID=3379816 RepID=UPI00385A2C7A